MIEEVKMNDIELNVLNEELKRLHEQLTLVACDEQMRNRILDMIGNLHTGLFPMYFVPKGAEFL